MTGPNTLLYTMGGGLGHISRLWWALAQAERRDTQALVAPPGQRYLLSASPYARALAPRMNATWLCPPANLNGDAHGFRDYLQYVLTEFHIGCVWLDAFPRGILGELSAEFTVESAWIHFARRLRFTRYQRRGPEASPPRFTQTFICEALEAQHLSYLRLHSDAMIPLDLRPPTADERDGTPSWVPAQPFTLLVHSGAAFEQDQLRAVAQAQRDAGHIPAHWVELMPSGTGALQYPALSLWREASWVVSGAGFHSIRQGRFFQKNQIVLPFPRRLDDQAWRAAAHRGAAGLQTATLPQATQDGAHPFARLPSTSRPTPCRRSRSDQDAVG